MENVEITGRARGAAAVILYDAPESVIRNCTIDQSGADRDGVHLTDSVSTLLDGGSVTTSRYPFVVGLSGQTEAGVCLLEFDTVPSVRQSTETGSAFQSGSTVVIEESEYRVDGSGVLGSDGCLVVDDFTAAVEGENTLAITGTNDGRLEWLRFVPR